MTGRSRVCAVAGALAFAVIGAAEAGITVGYYTDFNAGAEGWANPIAMNGYVGIQVLDITSFDFSSVDIMVIDESSNGEISADLLSRAGDLDAYTLGGGRVVIHDRYVTDNSFIPGGGGISLFRDFTFDTDLDVVTGGTLVTDGPFGMINDATLDGGTSSNHGWAENLPGGATTFLSSGPEAFRAGAFGYVYGGGYVYYSSIPMDFYLAGNGPKDPGDAFRGVYAPNVLAHVAGIPAPGALGLLAAAGLLGVSRRRRS